MQEFLTTVMKLPGRDTESPRTYILKEFISYKHNASRGTLNKQRMGISALPKLVS